MNPAFRELELLVAKIQKQLAPHSEVSHNVKLPGRKSGVDRQIDVLVRDQIGQYEIKIIIDCKDHKEPIDVNGVGAFNTLYEDVGAQKAVLVSAKGFTDGAKQLAKTLQIDLYSPVDTDPHKWQAIVSIPAICDYRSALISFGLSASSPLPWRIDNEYYTHEMIYDGDGKELDTCLAAAADKWNAGQWPIDPGTYEHLPIFDVPVTKMDNGYRTIAPIELWATIYVERHLYYGQAPVPKISGFKDHHTGLVIANAFTVGILDANEVEEKWLPIQKFEDAPVRPVLQIRGLVAWVQER